MPHRAAARPDKVHLSLQERLRGACARDLSARLRPDKRQNQPCDTALQAKLWKFIKGRLGQMLMNAR